jgi:endonuclease YncB( thermonuclease family)
VNRRRRPLTTLHVIAVGLAFALTACQASPQTLPPGGADTPLSWARDAYLGELGPPAPTGTATTCTITRIVDGDTVHCAPVGRIRLIGIDSPERGQEPHFTAASDAIAQLLGEGTLVWAEEDREERDRFGRPLRYLWVGDDGPERMVNWLMVRAGYAVELTYRPNDRYQRDFAAAEAQAGQERAGLWAEGGFGCLPLDARRGVCR